RLVFNDSLFVLASSNKRNPGECSSVPSQPFCVTANVNCPCGKFSKSESFMPRSRPSGAIKFSFHLPMNLSWNGFIAASFQKSHCGERPAAFFSATKWGMVKTNSVSDGSNSSADGISAREEMANKKIAAKGHKERRKKFFFCDFCVPSRQFADTNLFFIRFLVRPARRLEVAIRIVRI